MGSQGDTSDIYYPETLIMVISEEMTLAYRKWEGLNGGKKWPIKS